MTRSKTLLNLDRELIAQAQRILGTDTITATIDRALREVVRRAAAEELLDLAAQGLFRTPGTGS